MTVDEISAAIGMNDANYLARRFRKIEGMSPGEYRKNGKTETANHFQQIGQKMVCGFSLQFRKGTADRIYVYRVH